MKLNLKKYFSIFWSSIAFTRLYLVKGLPIKKFAHAYLCYLKVYLNHELEVDEFFRYRLWEKRWSDEDCLEFIGWKKHILSLRLLNPVQYRCATENKLLFHGMCEAAGISVPELIGVFDPNLSSYGKIPVAQNYEELVGLVQRSGIKELIIKPVEGTRGQSILALYYHEREKMFYTPSKSPVDEKMLMESISEYEYRGACQSTYMIQERIYPHKTTVETLSAYCPFSYRVLTILNDYHQPELLAVYAKSGVGDCPTDNMYTGGLALVLNDKGSCMGARKMSHLEKLITTHPETGIDLLEFKAPCFEPVLDLARQTATVFPYNRCVAWDIVTGLNAKGEHVVCVLEGNNPWNMNIQEVQEKGLWQGVFKEQVEQASMCGECKSPWFN